MKPDINIALLNAAQEIINRFSPLIDDEYEKSRLGSWGALILISAMKFNDASSSLQKENISTYRPGANKDRRHNSKIMVLGLRLNFHLFPSEK